MKIDEEPFLSDHFDVNAYANAVLAGRTYDPNADASSSQQNSKGKGKSVDGEKGDVGLELAKLNYGIVSGLASTRLTMDTGRCDETATTRSRSW